jgi:hypothetical protein
MADDKNELDARRADVIRAVTAGLGLVSQAFLAVSVAAQRAADALQAVVESLAEQDEPPESGGVVPPDPTGGPTGPTGPMTIQIHPPTNP